MSSFYLVLLDYMKLTAAIDVAKSKYILNYLNAPPSGKLVGHL